MTSGKINKRSSSTCATMRKGSSQQRLALLEVTEPELLATLHAIDRAKKALRGHHSATGSFRSDPNTNVVVVMPIASRTASSGSKRTVSDSSGYDSTVHAGCKPPPRHYTSSVATRTDLPRPQRTSPAETRMLKPRKDQIQTALSRDLMPKPDQTAEQKQQQQFLNRRAALYRPAPPKSSDSPVSANTSKSHHRRHYIVDVQVSESGSPLRLGQEEALVSWTWKESFGHFLNFFGSGPAQAHRLGS